MSSSAGAGKGDSLKDKVRRLALSTLLATRQEAEEAAAAAIAPAVPAEAPEAAGPPPASPAPSSTPSPLVLSEGSSPSPSPPPEEPAPQRFFAEDSVMTRENCDPMLSAAVTTGLQHQHHGGGIGSGPLAAAPSMNLLSPPDLTAASNFFGNRSPLQLQQQQQQQQQQPHHHLRLSTTSTDSQQSLNASAHGYDMQAAAAAQPPPPATLTQGPADPPRKEQINLLGCFAVSLNVPAAASRGYVAHVFDRGTYLSEGTDADPDLLAHLRTPEGTCFQAVYAKVDPNRSSFDQVALQLDSSGVWTTVDKPGSAVQAIQTVREGRPLFLQLTAPAKVDAFFRSAFGAGWVLGAKLIVNTSSPAADGNEDFRHFASRRVAAPNSSQTLHFSSGTLTLHADDGRGGGGDQAAGGGAPPAAAAVGIVGRQYESLTEDQSLQCTFCAVCNKRFKYVMEHLLHFTMSSQCRNFVLSTSNSYSNNNKPSNAKHSFFSLLADVLSRRCGLPRQSRLVCDRCLSTVAGPVEYAMHRDSHRPPLGDLFLCQFCGRLYRTPHCFYRHPCVKHWNVGQMLRLASEGRAGRAAARARALRARRQQAGDGGAADQQDAFKIYSGLTEEERAGLTRCPACKKQHAYMSGLVSHLRSSSACFSSALAASRSSSPAAAEEEVLDLPSVMLNVAGPGSGAARIDPRQVKCEDCGVCAANQVAYAGHKDHHGLRRQGMLICKGCDSEYQTPCEFYRHACSAPADNSDVGGNVRLHWCPFCDVCRMFDGGGGDDADGSAGDVGKSSLQIVSVQSLATAAEAGDPPDLSSLRLKLNPNGEGSKKQPRGRPRKKKGPPPPPPPSLEGKRARTAAAGPVAKKSTSKIPWKLRRRRAAVPDLYVCRGCSPRRILRGAAAAASHRCFSGSSSSSPMRGPRRAGMPERLGRYNRFRLAVADSGLAEDDGANGADRVREELARIRGDGAEEMMEL